MATAIVEFDPLPDAVGAAAEDDDLFTAGGVRLAHLAARQRTFVGRIHIRGRRRKLGRACVDSLVDREHPERPPPARHFQCGEACEVGEPRIRKAHRLQLAERALRLGQSVSADLGLNVDNLLQARDEPRIDSAKSVDLLMIDAEAKRLRDLQDAVGRGRAKRFADDVLVVALAESLQHVVVEAGQTDLHRAQRLLQAFVEGAPDRHDFADRFHGGREYRRRAGKLLEREARNFRHHVIDRRLEGRGRRAFGDVVVEFVQRVAHRQFRGDLRDGEARRFRGERRGPRHARIHLDNDKLAVRWIDRELNVRTARLHADLPQDGDRSVAHDLELAVRQRQRRRDRDAVARVNAHRIDVLDGADDDAVVLRVADNLHLILFPAEHRFLDQDLAGRRSFEPALGDVQVFFAVVRDAAAGSAKREGRPDDRGQLHIIEGGLHLRKIVGEHGARRGQPDFPHRLAEEQAILGLVDGLGLRPDHLHLEAVERPVARQPERSIERGLSAHGGQKRHPLARVLPLLALDHLGDHVRRDRLDIGGVRQIRVRHDRGGIRIDEDDSIPLGLQRLAGLRAGIIEFAGLADHDRASPNDEDGVDISPFGHFERSGLVGL